MSTLELVRLYEESLLALSALDLHRIDDDSLKK